MTGGAGVSAVTAPTSDWYVNPAAREYLVEPVPLAALRFHRRFAGYEPTPLRECPQLAESLRVGRVFVKEEAGRFGLPSFKMVGALWGVYRALVARSGQPGRDWTFDELALRFGGDDRLTLVCATDGNHGRAVAHTASLLDLAAHVFVPEEIGQTAKDAIMGEGARLTQLAAPYDEVVAAAFEKASSTPNSLMVQDTGWDGYEQIPGWIVEGYSTIFREIDGQLAAEGIAGPDLVVTPCGVGSLIQAATAHYRAEDYLGGGIRPSLVSVEEIGSACLLRSLHAGHPVSVQTGATRMAGLNCGTVSSIAWPILHGGVDVAVAVTEKQDYDAVRELEELGIDSGPCGAASLAGLGVVLGDSETRQAMGVTDESVVVLISSESRKANPLD